MSHVTILAPLDFEIGETRECRVHSEYGPRSVTWRAEMFS
jgi:hypothetical protein